jgi:hypothetical protein
LPPSWKQQINNGNVRAMDRDVSGRSAALGALLLLASCAAGAEFEGDGGITGDGPASLSTDITSEMNTGPDHLPADGPRDSTSADQPVISDGGGSDHLVGDLTPSDLAGPDSTDSPLAPDQLAADGPPADQPLADHGPGDQKALDQIVPDQTAADGGTGENCQNGVDDDGDGLVDCADPNCAAVSPCIAPAATFVLHEVHPGTPDYLVLRNASSAPLNLAGHQLTLVGIETVLFTLPSRMLQPGETVHVYEYSDGQVSLGDINTGDNLPFSNGFSDNGVALANGAGAILDYVGFGSVLVGKPPTVSFAGGPLSYVGYDVMSQSHFRAAMNGVSPSLTAADWKTGPKSRP